MRRVEKRGRAHAHAHRECMCFLECGEREGERGGGGVWGGERAQIQTLRDAFATCGVCLDCVGCKSCKKPPSEMQNAAHSAECEQDDHYEAHLHMLRICLAFICGDVRLHYYYYFIILSLFFFSFLKSIPV